jgi:hypothetical protein
MTRAAEAPFLPHLYSLYLRCRLQEALASLLSPGASPHLEQLLASRALGAAELAAAAVAAEGTPEEAAAAQQGAAPPPPPAMAAGGRAAALALQALAAEPPGVQQAHK